MQKGLGWKMTVKHKWQSDLFLVPVLILPIPMQLSKPSILGSILQSLKRIRIKGIIAISEHNAANAKAPKNRLMSFAHPSTRYHGAVVPIQHGRSI